MKPTDIEAKQGIGDSICSFNSEAVSYVKPSLFDGQYHAALCNSELIQNAVHHARCRKFQALWAVSVHACVGAFSSKLRV